MSAALESGGTGPHAGRPVLWSGAPLAKARAALILVHGRGGDAADMLSLARHVVGRGIACLAPEAAGHSWYPHRFLEPPARNEPGLSSGLAVLEDLVARTGLPPERVALLGFSQGACLALEFLVRRRVPLGAVIGLSGGLIGDVLPPVEKSHVLDGTAVLLACARQDAHIPAQRVLESEAVLRGLGATVTTHLHEGDFHGVNTEDVVSARAMLARLG